MHIEPNESHLYLPTVVVVTTGDQAGERSSYGFVLSAHPGARGGGHLHTAGSQPNPTRRPAQPAISQSPRPGTTRDAKPRAGRTPRGSKPEVSCPFIPFDPQAASLMFMLVSRRYERASMIVTSNKPFSAWGEIFGDDMAATAMVDRLIHHAEILSLKGDSYRLKDRDLGPRPGRQTAEIA